MTDGDGGGDGGGADTGGGSVLPDLNETLGEILDLPGSILRGENRGEGPGPLGLFGPRRQSSGGARGLLDFLFGN